MLQFLQINTIPLKQIVLKTIFLKTVLCLQFSKLQLDTALQFSKLQWDTIVLKTIVLKTIVLKTIVKFIKNYSFIKLQFIKTIVQINYSFCSKILQFLKLQFSCKKLQFACICVRVYIIITVNFVVNSYSSYMRQYVEISTRHFCPCMKKVKENFNAMYIKKRFCPL